MANILLIEDQKFVAQIYTLLLSGHRVQVAHTGGDGLAAFKVETPDIVITDIQLPDMDGFQIISAIREMGAVPVIVLTANEEYAQEATKRGANLALRKPVSKESFRHALQGFIS